MGDLLSLRNLIDLGGTSFAVGLTKPRASMTNRASRGPCTLIVMIMMTRPGPRVRSSGTFPSCDSFLDLDDRELRKIRRDRAYRELERRRASLAKRMRQAANAQAEVEIANDENAQRAA